MDREMKFSIMAKSPLLTHNPASMKKPGKGRAELGGQTIPLPEVEAEAGLYINEGRMCFPGIGVRNAIVRAASAWGIPGGKKKDKLSSIIAHIIVKEEWIPILETAGKPVKNYSIDSRRAVVQRQGIIRSRPRFEDWRLDFTVIYDDEILGWEESTIRETIEKVLNDAGKRIGIGDYRPSNKGWFGRFEVSLNGKGKK